MKITHLKDFVARCPTPKGPGRLRVYIWGKSDGYARPRGAPPAADRYVDFHIGRSFETHTETADIPLTRGDARRLARRLLKVTE